MNWKNVCVFFVCFLPVGFNIVTHWLIKYKTFGLVTWVCGFYHTHRQKSYTNGESVILGNTVQFQHERIHTLEECWKNTPAGILRYKQHKIGNCNVFFLIVIISNSISVRLIFFFLFFFSQRIVSCSPPSLPSECQNLLLEGWTA